MKAIVYTEYGSPDVLRFTEVAKPTPKDDEVLVRVHAAAVNKADCYNLSGTPFIMRLMRGGLRKPKDPILGADVAGRVEAVGSKVTQFKPGDEVYGDLSGCGLGGFAEYVCAKESALAPKPARLSFEEAAAVPMSAVTALQGLRKGSIQAGQKVLINGASGGVGTFAVQIAKSFEAEVTVVCSTRNVEMVRSIGADHVMDYTEQDFTQSGQRYDLILAANGYHPIAAYQRALNPGGTYVMSGGSMAQIFEAMLLGPLKSMTSKKKMGSLMAHPSQKDLVFLTPLLEAGKVIPVIDRCYPLSEVPQAMRYLGEGHAKGKVVITVEQSS
jgi:NADPH:quinone reductase-like Zn-dependent oxidoreductase